MLRELPGPGDRACASRPTSPARSASPRGSGPIHPNAKSRADGDDTLVMTGQVPQFVTRRNAKWIEDARRAVEVPGAVRQGRQAQAERQGRHVRRRAGRPRHALRNARAHQGRRRQREGERRDDRSEGRRPRHADPRDRLELQRLRQEPDEGGRRPVDAGEDGARGGVGEELSSSFATRTSRTTARCSTASASTSARRPSRASCRPISASQSTPRAATKTWRRCSSSSADTS